MIYEKQNGVPGFICNEFAEKQRDYVLLIPVINEGERILRQLSRAMAHHISDYVDIVICDGGSTDGSTEEGSLRKYRVNALLVKQDEGCQGAQLRMGIWWALNRGYRGVLTIDGNNKDSIEDVPRFIEKLEQGYDFVQGSRFVAGGRAIRTPWLRLVSVRGLHAPLISLAARKRFTDTTNAYRAYSVRYLTDQRVQPLREIFVTYELLAYLSVRATQIGLKACEIPVTRAYPKQGKTPTKISFFKGNLALLRILLSTLMGTYRPK
ncbi:MAG: glycosyltransferase family 2 protein [Lachnospiraceae bacterium]|nr:glycosyltransferase family 2 protein [Lachnospiraceae bacterium]MDY5743027.1 glycosyltransferase family 2 protein [Lachnospiraceae bacterium]